MPRGLLRFFAATERTDREQPITAWAKELRAAGFTLTGPPTLLHNYWWAPAYLLEATPTDTVEESAR